MEKRKALIVLGSLLALFSCSSGRHMSRFQTGNPVDPAAPVFDSISPQFRPVARLFASRAQSLPVSGNGLEIFTYGRPKFDALFEDIRKAEVSIDLEYYRFSPDTIGRDLQELLLQKAREGVVVRILLENRTNPPKPSFYNRFKGVEGLYLKEVQPRNDWSGTLSNLLWRNHRKIVVIDGKTAYLGGMNVQDRYHTIWRDTHARVTGPIVEALSLLFQENWDRFSGPEVSRPEARPVREGSAGLMQLVGDGGVFTQESIIKDGLELALSRAKDYFYIQNPYFCPPESTIQALIDAAQRGVDVQLMFPETQDVIVMLWLNHYFYKRLLEGGVRIFERSGAFMHSKTFVSDDCFACIGSANIDYRSFYTNLEGNLYIYDRDMALRCKDIYLQDLSDCREIRPEDIRWTVPERYLQSIIIIGAPQF